MDDYCEKQAAEREIIDNELTSLFALSHKFNIIGEALFISGNMNLSDQMHNFADQIRESVKKIQEAQMRSAQNYMKLDQDAQAQFLKTIFAKRNDDERICEETTGTERDD